MAKREKKQSFQQNFSKKHFANLTPARSASKNMNGLKNIFWRRDVKREKNNRFSKKTAKNIDAISVCEKRNNIFLLHSLCARSATKELLVHWKMACFLLGVPLAHLCCPQRERAQQRNRGRSEARGAWQSTACRTNNVTADHANHCCKIS